MDDDSEKVDPYDDDPYSDDEPLTDLAIRILKAHRDDPARDDFIMLPNASLAETNAAYSALRKKGLVEYADRVIELPVGRRPTFQLTRNGL